MSPITSSGSASGFEPAKARPRAIAVLVVSDVRLYCEGLAQSLSGRGCVQVIASADNADAALERMRAGGVDVAVLDMAMPDALSLVRRAVREAPAVRVVAYALIEVAANVLACAEAGVDGYVPSHGSLADLVSAVECVADGGTVCSSCMAAPLFRQLGRRPLAAAQLPLALTARERDIAELLDGGLSNKAIAARLGIELATVKQHVHNILDKLGVSGRAEAVAQLRRHAPRTLAARSTPEESPRV
ncbi:MAG: response regulator transcription factor [Gemmatimonadaceae bacterium]|nr:response regulator transcription factor [Gemmatimonadaceae bacterium]NUQ92470.1 response regulator transcription factor [Gemmatimonadaceae bacterium]NUR19501.1 response regulator transcription factor [Gemmatimonadaceae bacterium]NUS96883.1 response regulator transcription factor [Gemmatimonadaceae bacterium]